MSLNLSTPSAWEAFEAALISGGDKRLDIAAKSLLNKYLCPARPAPRTICFSSCTASPISHESYEAALRLFEQLTPANPFEIEPDTIAVHEAEIRSRIARHFGVEALAEVIIAPSGTDATLILMGLIAGEHPDCPILSIVAGAAETGSGVPLAAAGRHFSGIAASGRMVEVGTRVAGFSDGCHAVGIASRTPGGAVRPATELEPEIRDWVGAGFRARMRPVIHLIDGSKTGLVLSLEEGPRGAAVIVDACQGRLPMARLRGYLERGWPVLVTGSKFYGGPAFSGAILYPRQRGLPLPPAMLRRGLGDYGWPGDRRSVAAVRTGPLLRWAAALAEMDRYQALGQETVSERIRQIGHNIEARIERSPGLEFIQPPEGCGPTTIFPIALSQSGTRLSACALRPLYRELAARGILIGQPVEIGRDWGALRIAIGARTLHEPFLESALDRLFHALERVGRLKS